MSTSEWSSQVWTVTMTQNSGVSLLTHRCWASNCYAAEWHCLPFNTWWLCRTHEKNPQEYGEVHSVSQVQVEYLWSRGFITGVAARLYKVLCVNGTELHYSRKIWPLCMMLVSGHKNVVHEPWKYIFASSSHKTGNFVKAINKDGAGCTRCFQDKLCQDQKGDYAKIKKVRSVGRNVLLEKYSNILWPISLAITEL